tara:strand:+ start:302 stop:403 length:102 start_codon:yes stop_codon:yes gene_type:complete
MFFMMKIFDEKSFLLKKMFDEKEFYEIKKKMSM